MAREPNLGVMLDVPDAFYIPVGLTLAPLIDTLPIRQRRGRSYPGEGVIGSGAPAQPYVRLAGELVAAETGTFKDRKAARIKSPSFSQPKVY
jgi:hypothetical protein